MKKNVLFWIGVKSKSDLMLKKHGQFEYLEISKLSWKYWCDKNNVIFYEYKESSESDTGKHRVTWTRWFDVFNQLNQSNIQYNKIAVIDGHNIVRWDTPNFFNLTNGKITAFRSLENLKWLYQAVQGYKKLFNNYEFDTTKYISTGFQIFDKDHEKFLLELKNFYYENNQKILELQKTVHRGTDQTPYNYLLQIKNIKVDSLPAPYLLTHLNRFDWFKYNWQLNEDKTPYFIKYGYIWAFSGFDRTLRNDLMKQVWDSVKHKYE